MLAATLMALAAAVLHAGWNLVAKRSAAPFIALWGQFAVAALIGAAVLAIGGGIPAAGWGYAAITGLIHVPYLAGLAAAYEHGDFSLAYPIARGGGALLAGIGGIVLLGDELNPWSIAAIVTVVAGMMLLAVGAAPGQVVAALFVAVTIGAYTLNDSYAARELGGNLYPFAVFLASGVLVSLYGMAIGRTGEVLVAIARRLARVRRHRGDVDRDVHVGAARRAAGSCRLRRRPTRVERRHRRLRRHTLPVRGRCPPAHGGSGDRRRRPRPAGRLRLT